MADENKATTNRRVYSRGKPTESAYTPEQIQAMREALEERKKTQGRKSMADENKAAPIRWAYSRLKPTESPYTPEQIQAMGEALEEREKTRGRKFAYKGPIADRDIVAHFPAPGLLMVSPSYVEADAAPVSHPRHAGGISPFDSLDAWRAKGPMGFTQSRAFDQNRDQGEYDGGEARATPTRAPQAYIMAAFSSHRLALKDRSADMPSAMAGNALALQYRTILEAGGEPALRLLRAAAQIGGKAAVEAGEISRGPDDFAAANEAFMERFSAVDSADAIKLRKDAFARSAAWAMSVKTDTLKAQAEGARRSPEAEAGNREVAAEFDRIMARREKVLAEIDKVTVSMSAAEKSAWKADVFATRKNLSEDEDARAGGDKARMDTRTEAKDTEVRVSSGGAFPSPRFTVVALTADEARVMRSMIDYALTLMPPEKGYEPQKLLRSPDELPSPEAMAAVAKGWMRPPVANRFLDEKTGAPVKVVGVISGYGHSAANVAADLVKNTKADVAFALDGNPALWSAVERRDPSQKLLRLGGPRGSRDVVLRETINKSDAVMVVWNGKKTDASYVAIAQAYRRGALVATYNDNGQKLDVDVIGRQAVADIPSQRALKQRMNENVFDFPAAEPEARFAMSLLRNADGSMKNKDIFAASASGMTLKEIAEIARDDVGKARLVRETGMSAAAAKLFGDDAALDVARSGYTMSINAINGAGMKVIGPESYPDALLRSGKFPPFMFAMGDVSLLTEPRPVVGVIQNDALNPDFAHVVERGLPEIVSGVRERGAIVAQLEPTRREILPDMTPDVLLVGSGINYGTEAQLANRVAVLASGGVVLSILPPVMNGIVKVPPQRKGDAYVKKPNWSKDFGGGARNTAADVLAGMAETVVVPSFDARARDVSHRVLEEALVGGRRPIVFDQSHLPFPETSGNREILSGEGLESLRKAGFGQAAVASLTGTFDGGYPAISAGRHPERAAEAVMKVVSGEIYREAAEKALADKKLKNEGEGR